MDQTQRRHDDVRPDDTQDDGSRDAPARRRGRSTALRATGRHLLEAADASIARAEAMESFLNEELSRDSTRFLESIRQTSGQ